jgi:hypothetical protein
VWIVYFWKRGNSLVTPPFSQGPDGGYQSDLQWQSEKHFSLFSRGSVCLWALPYPLVLTVFT